MQSLIEDPSCFVKYQSTNVLKPYLTELVDQGKIKDEDGKIKKFYKRGKVNAGVSDTPKLVLSQNFLDILTAAYKKYKEDLANHSDMSCPLTRENACENSDLAVAAVPNATNQKSLKMCIIFIGWHPNCLMEYETKDFIKPYLETLADSGKIEGYAPNSSAPGNSTGNAGAAATQGTTKTPSDAGSSLLDSTGSTLLTPDAHAVAGVGVQSRDVITSGQEPGIIYEEISRST
jgi:hypothetical protein